MSDDALAQHIDDRMLNGELAADPDNPEVRNLVGTVQLVQSALSSPSPPELAESASRERALLQMREGGLSSRSLTVSPSDAPDLFQKIKNWFRGNR